MVFLIVPHAELTSLAVVLGLGFLVASFVLVLATLATMRELNNRDEISPWQKLCMGDYLSALGCGTMLEIFFQLVGMSAYGQE